MTKKISVLLTLSLLGVFGCAKSPEYETVYKSPKMTTINEEYDTTSEYLYVPSTLGTPREITHVSGFFQGQPKIVKIRFTEDGIEVYQENHGTRGSDNALNDLPVLTIPGTYHSFKCAENSLGECTNREEENNRLEWNQKPHFTPDFANLMVKEVNALDFSSGEADSCLQNISTKLVDFNIERGLINIELEKTYKTSTSEDCISNKLKNMSFNVRFYYSLVKLENLISKDYEPINYPVKDQSTFGFFTENTTKEDDTLHSNRRENIFLMKRWNPKKGKIIYDLGRNFSKPDNAQVKELTFKAFESINKTLDLAQAGFNIELRESSTLSPGDIRHSVINLIDETIESGLLGYGPTVANPRTGEIIRGTVNMYSGALRLTLRGLWNDMVAVTKKSKKLENSPVAVPDSEDMPVVSETPASTGETAPNLTSESRTLPARTGTNSSLNKELSTTKVPGELMSMVEKNEKLLKKYSEHCAFVPEFLNSSVTAKNLLPGIEKLSGDFFNGKILKDWSELTAGQKKIAENFIFPYIYTTTLIHEMGHNLGLRHNFGGSFDKANFFSEKEAKEHNLSHIPKYSSIMDYTGNDMEENLFYGKYDIAAFRFGYARKVETVDGRLIPVAQTLSKTLEANKDVKLKPFFYCTDENEGLSPQCNKFDEGTNYTEIASNIIEKYEYSHDFLNYRDGRNDYDTSFSRPYFESRYRQFKQLRSIFEDWKRDTRFLPTQKIFGCSTSTAENPIYKASCEDLADKTNASIMAGRFFLRVIKTPDHLCALANPETPNETVKLESLSKILEKNGSITKGAFKSCFDPALVDLFNSTVEIDGSRFIIRGEVGKYLNNQIANDSDHNDINDIGAVGIWMDKLLATKFLFQRFDEIPGTSGTDNLTIFPEIEDELRNLYIHVMAGAPLYEPVKFTNKDGEEYEDNLAYTLTFDETINQKDIDSFMVKFFDLQEMGNPSLFKSVLGNAKKWELALGGYENKDARKHVNFFTVGFRPKDQGSFDDKLFRSHLLGDYYVYADEGNTLASKMIYSVTLFNALESIGPEKVKKVYDMVNEPPFIATLPQKEKKAAELGLDGLKLVKQIKEKDPNTKLNSFKEYLRALKIPSTVKRSYNAYFEVFKNNSMEELDKVITRLADYEKELDVSLADSKDLRKLSSQKPQDVKSYLDGTLAKEKDLNLKALENLPSAPRFYL
jgi:Met-zincin